MYRAITGETIGGAITRLRIERGAQRLCDAPSRSVSEIALEVGYAMPSSFNKAFRAALDVSPTQFRTAASHDRQAWVAALHASTKVTPPVPMRISSEPRITRRADMRVLHVRECGEYANVAAPLAWAHLERQLASSALARCERIGASHDDPRNVASEALRYDAAVVVEPHTVALPGTSAALWRGGAFAAFEYRGPYRFIADAFDVMFRGWVVRAGARLRPAPCLEIYHDPSDVPDDERLTELWIPISDP